MLTGYTYDQIADMNVFQQASLLSSEGESLHFRTEREYIEWKISRGL